MPLTMAQSVTSLRHAWGELNSRGVRSNFLIFSPGFLTHKICYFLLILPGFLTFYLFYQGFLNYILNTEVPGVSDSDGYSDNDYDDDVQ